MSNCKRTSIGGQAVIEGVMMKGVDEIATAVRKPDGEIVIKKEKLKGNRKKIGKIPVLRGMYAFVDSMVLGVGCLMYSAEFFEEEEIKPGKKESKLDKFMNDNMIIIAVIISIMFSTGFFILLPTVAVNFAHRISSNPFVLNIIEGIVRIAIFLIYILAVSRLEDIRRVFQYHGAEHKTIFCYESGEELTVENVKKHGRLHPRCGTSFLFIVMIVSILMFSLFKWPTLLVRLVTRILLLPIVAGLSYEVIKWAGRSDSSFSKFISAPGMWLQKITTAEPDESQIEVAIAALKGVLPADKEADNW